jgi:SNF2 family DNA or RNA helicase
MPLDYSAFCELSPDGKRIEVHFRYNAGVVAALKEEVNGARFVPREKGGPYWTVPKDMTSARELRRVFGDGLELGKAVKAWGKEANKRSRNLQSLAQADDAKLKNVPKKLRKFLRPFQRADVAFMAQASVANFNEQGLGKTIESIAAIIEAGLDDRPVLVVAPKTSLETVWSDHVNTWLPDVPTYVLSGDTTQGELHNYMGYALRHKSEASPFWLITTANQIRKGLPHALASVKWGTLIVDEFHRMGLTNVNGDPTKGTQFGRAVRDIEREKSFFLSGTPIGGRPIKLWGILHHLRPEVFTSKWRWAGQWLDVTTNDFGGREIGEMKKEREDEFYPAHAEYIVRRLKSEVLPQLPPKQYIDVWCDMLPQQKKQYEKMAKDAEIRIDGERLSAVGVLAEYARLKQFASAERTIVDGALLPKASGKLEALIERLDEAGIRRDDSTGDNVAVVASQSKVFINWVAEQLNAKGIRTETITGDTKGRDRKSIIKRFQSGKDSPRVVAVTTTAGGVAITLDRADTVHILDETWNPDDQVQLEDRLHRISRIHQVMCYYYRSRGTVEEAIHELNEGKAVTNENIMDIRRKMWSGQSDGSPD